MKPIHVLKIGGSLLDWPALPERLNQLIETRPDARIVLIVGGGRLADALRQYDQIHSIGESSAHQLALRSLDVTAEILHALMKQTIVITSLFDLDLAWNQGKTPILAPRRTLLFDRTLPQLWSVTTDSIAARVAQLLDADDLLLIKSTPPAPTLQAAVEQGIVDPFFPIACEGLKSVHYCNLRHAPIEYHQYCI